MKEDRAGPQGLGPGALELPIHQPLEKEPVFPPMVTRMIAVGEETGDLEGVLTKIAQFYESEVDAAVKTLTSIIEPVMILVVGGIVGGIIVVLVSIYKPYAALLLCPADQRRRAGSAPRVDSYG